VIRTCNPSHRAAANLDLDRPATGFDSVLLVRIIEDDDDEDDDNDKNNGNCNIIRVNVLIK